MRKSKKRSESRRKLGVEKLEDRLVLAVTTASLAQYHTGNLPEPSWMDFSKPFINEIHYDNVSADIGEAIEIAGLAGTDLTGWMLVRYDGATGTQYGQDALSGTISDQGQGVGTV